MTNTTEAALREPIERLCPIVGEAKKLRRQMEQHGGVIDQVIRAAALYRPSEKLLSEVYLAGLWHGSEIMRQRGEELARPARRNIDRIDVAVKRGRGRRKAS